MMRKTAGRGMMRKTAGRGMMRKAAGRGMAGKAQSPHDARGCGARMMRQRKVVR